MSARRLDPTFTALPYRELGDAALGRARELGASHADFRFERVRYQHLGVRDGVLQGAQRRRGPRLRGPGDPPRRLGLRLRRGAHPRRGASGSPRPRSRSPQVAAEMTSAPVEIAPEPVHDDVTWVSSYDVNPLEVPIAEKAALLIDWTDRLRTGAAVDHAIGLRSSRCRRTSTTPTWPAPAPPSSGSGSSPGFEAMGAGADTFDSMRQHRAARSAAAGSTSPTGSLRLGRRDRRGARAARREAQGAEHRGRHATTWSSTPRTSG